MRLRLSICVLVAGFLLYHSVEQFSIGAAGLSGWFALLWFVFAVLVLGGNLSALFNRRRRVYREPVDRSLTPHTSNTERGRERLRA